MTFLNGIMLFGLAGVAIPIIIHILNRRRATVVEWGAMQFLETSLASRNRRILIEEIILMILRCALLAALAFALARPFLTTGRILLGKTDDAQDLAIVIDASLSMTAGQSGRSNFQRAIDEAHQLVQVCGGSDAVSVILAGPVAQTVIPSPVSDRDEVHETLDKLSATGGSMRVLEALHAATLTLSSGTNPAKRIILITDGQGIGWDLSASKRWEFLAEAVESLPTRPIIIVRTLATPQKWRNASASALNFSRTVIGTDRSVRITATVANTGSGAVAPEAVEFIIDGKVERCSIGGIAEGASGSVDYDHHFTSPGPHVVSVRVVCDDDLPGDNETTRVVNVLDTLPVLIVEGTSSTRSRDGDGDFLALAFDPDGANGRPEQADAGGDDGPDDHLIDPTVVSAADIASVKGFGDYTAVVLANVPRLPAGTAKKLTDFVASGGGLLITPGERAGKDFYNNWLAGDGNRLIGCRLVKVHTDQSLADPDKGAAHISPNSINHPALTLLSNPTESDLAAARIRRHWVLAPDDNDRAVTVGASLDCGDAYLVQRRLGKGFVLTLPVPMNTDFCDLPRHLNRCFLPMVHELVYYLSAPAQPAMNLLPGQQFVYTIPGIAANNSGASAGTAEVAGPDGRRTAMRLRKRQGRRQATYSLTARPGLYRLFLSAFLKQAGKHDKTGTTGDKSETADEGAKAIPFVVMSDPDESKLELLTNDDYNRAGQFVRLSRAETIGELTAAIRGGVPGSEIWRQIAIVVMVLLIAEIITTRAIAAKRKMHLAEPVAFGADRNTAV